MAGFVCLLRGCTLGRESGELRPQGTNKSGTSYTVLLTPGTRDVRGYGLAGQV